jgi:hypothetical protein
MPTEVRAREGRVRELLQQYHTGTGFRRALQAAAAESGLDFNCLVAEVGPARVHVVHDNDALNPSRIEDVVARCAQRWAPAHVQVTVDSAANMGRKSLALIEANHKLHTENAALKQRVASLSSLVGAILLSVGLIVAFVIWRGVVGQ